jgi:hypothetical protein
MQNAWRRETPIDVINVVLGAVLFLSPWLFHFVDETTASRNAWIAGALIVIASICAIAAFVEWEEWLNLLFGLWVLVSPWILGFHSIAVAMRTHVALGIGVAVLAAIELLLLHRAPPHVTA